ncbi:hypothetical protein [Novacetimonas hansenii]|uniref:Uncharacterized protein n=1 Tax=Novacetimonas hansenii TaxID=436 RepID=A0ABQ0SGX8_NOVHA|nr:hypothetical protein [Novacetimonas hansenii]GAN84017.1 hypothetical protein Gaha_0122_017 [Novacetimonas hansenii JCM 7643]GBQ55769.1 hypothetical protein AA0243_1005 [Novacetimonas hansenii NRIC 0243]GEC64597.1 hypothetical protein GHA01_24460 [Novacetimonas hansenii]
MSRQEQTVVNEKYDKNYTNIKVLESEKPKAYYLKYKSKPCSIKKEMAHSFNNNSYLPKVMTESKAKNQCKKLNEHFNTTDFSYEEL